MTNKIVITRHPALIEFLKEINAINGTEAVLTHATAREIEGRDVIGVLPMHLASFARSVTEVGLDIPADKRGKELTIDEIRQFFTGLNSFVVIKTEDIVDLRQRLAFYLDIF